MKIGNKEIGGDNPCFIIAELSANHNGDLNVAIATIRAAKKTGADAIKLQTYTPDTLTIDCDNKHFKIESGTLWDGKTLYQLYGEAYTPWEWHKRLFEVAEEEGLICFSSPFDFTAVDFLEKQNVPAYKIASFEIQEDLPDEKERGQTWDKVPEGKYPYWLGLGVVYEHFHTAKSNRSPTTRRLVPEMYVEMHVEDAKELGINDGDKVRLVTRRGHYEAKAQVGIKSLVKPARNSVPRGYMFSPWNLSVADSADPKKNKWLVNGVSSRVWDIVSGQVDFKKLACRIEKI